MALRNIMRYPDDGILRKKSEKIEKIDERTQILLEDMAETMYASNGVGLAAVQVGVLRRAVVVDGGTGLLKLVNPVIVEASGEQQEFESCLSIPRIWGRVRRPERVVVHAWNEYGWPVDWEATGFLASAFCHEIDHLDGILFIDKVLPGSLLNQNEVEPKAPPA